MSAELLQTPFHAWHVAQGARMVDFAGWDMPVQYTSISEEHPGVRTACGLFDVSHMGRLAFYGPDSQKFLDHIVTNDCSKIPVQRIRYALVCNESGGILDDVLVYNVDDMGEWHLVVNASNREKIVAWLHEHSDGFDVQIVDRTESTFMLALQGPRAMEIADELMPTSSSKVPRAISELKYYSFCEPKLGDVDHVLVSRTGYTGEDGIEIIGASEDAGPVLSAILAAGASRGLVPAGLGCRDTLRLEAAMPLYGHELNESTDPLTAGLDFAVKLEAGDFIGREALLRCRDDGIQARRVGLELEGKRIAREHTPVFAIGDEAPIGTVTSGTFSPTLEKAIAMAYVEFTEAEPGTLLEVDLRGKRLPATVVELPFYKRS